MQVGVGQALHVSCRQAGAEGEEHAVAAVPSDRFKHGALVEQLVELIDRFVSSQADRSSMAGIKAASLTADQKVAEFLRGVAECANSPRRADARGPSRDKAGATGRLIDLPQQAVNALDLLANGEVSKMFRRRRESVETRSEPDSAAPGAGFDLVHIRLDAIEDAGRVRRDKASTGVLCTLTSGCTCGAMPSPLV